MASEASIPGDHLRLPDRQGDVICKRVSCRSYRHNDSLLEFHHPLIFKRKTINYCLYFFSKSKEQYTEFTTLGFFSLLRKLVKPPQCLTIKCQHVSKLLQPKKNIEKYFILALCSCGKYTYPCKKYHLPSTKRLENRGRTDGHNETARLTRRELRTVQLILVYFV